ncbi:hypothetical protein [Virgisporangium aurantiacum]|uniref:hypothetical protein n=1 Tax=Virgisporangium aurantiacum TaxID=175570 RepID=UPI00194EA33B|nr:hypothetical protein [Virgisporangium aurantiacum]
MSLTSDDLDVIRRRRSYRAGIWVARAALPVGLLCLILIVTDPDVRFSGPLTFVSLVGSVFSSRQDDQARVALRRTLHRDVFGLGLRPRPAGDV